jgi:hypothetical protein
MKKRGRTITVTSRLPVEVAEALDKYTSDLNDEAPIKRSVVQAMCVVKCLKEKGYLDKKKKYL